MGRCLGEVGMRGKDGNGGSVEIAPNLEMARLIE